MFVHQKIRQMADQYPDAEALCYYDQSLSYRELMHAVDQLAHYLQGRGVGLEDIVGVCCEREFDYIICILAILNVGAAYLPIAADYPEDRVHYIVDDAQPKLVFLDAERAALFENTHSELVFLDKIKDEITQESVAPLSVNLKDDNLAYVIYTSGSTGRPKGVLVEHQGIMNVIESHMRCTNIHMGERVLQFCNICFDISVLEWAAALCSGAVLCLTKADERPPYASLADMIHSKSINHLMITPSVLNTLPRMILPTVKTVTVGGEVLTTNLSDYFSKHVKLINAYGPSETTMLVTLKVCEPGGDITIGKPINHCQIYILDKEMQPVGQGEVGEILIGGICLARGYLGLPEETKESFVVNTLSDDGSRLYRTGDYARFLESGELQFEGRKDDQFKVRGHRIELGEVQRRLAEHVAIKRLVIKIVGHQYDRKLAAYFEVHGDHKVTEDEMSEHAKLSLPRYMWPSYFIRLDVMPLTPNGKVDMNLLPSYTYGKRVCQPPKTKTGIQLANVWADILNIELSSIGIYDNFFEIGGTSLSISRLIAAIEATFDIDISLHGFLDSPTIKYLQILIDNSTDMHESSAADLIEEDLELFGHYIGQQKASAGALSMNHILLTGVTGFLGAFLLHELHQTGAMVYCLIRAESYEKACRRLKDSLVRFNFGDMADSERVQVIVGDLSLPQCGMDAETFDTLSYQIDCIFHNGALVNHLYSYTELRNTNVLSTFELIKFSFMNRVKQFNYISSVSSIAATDKDDVGLESMSGEPSATFVNGYGATKWVSEQYVFQAGQQGLPVRIFRPGNITGDANTGMVVPDSNHLQLLLKAVVMLGKAPLHANDMIEMVPVNELVQAIVQLSSDSDSVGDILNMNNDVYMSWQQAVTYFQDYGYKIEFIDDTEWLTMALDFFPQTDLVYPLLLLYQRQYKVPIQCWRNQHAKTQRLKLSAGYAQDYQVLMRVYIQYLIAVGFIVPPL